MKQKKFTKTLLCFILSALVLSSCVNGEGSDADLSQDVSNVQSSSESSENVSDENSKEDVSEAGSIDNSKITEPQVLYSTIKHNCVENDGEYNEEPFYIKANSKYIYDYFENPENDGSYYAVSFWVREPKIEIKDYFNNYGITCDEMVYIGFGTVCFAHVTEEQIISLSKDESGLMYIEMTWLAKGEKEARIEDFHNNQKRNIL